MRFSDKGPDIPEDLIRAQLAGDVVFVVGAGVSRHVGLPLFNGLVARVYKDLGQIPPGEPNSLSDKAEAAAWQNDEWDRALGLLEQRIVYPDPSRPENKNPVRETVGSSSKSAQLEIVLVVEEVMFQSQVPEGNNTFIGIGHRVADRLVEVMT